MREMPPAKATTCSAMPLLRANNNNNGDDIWIVLDHKRNNSNFKDELRMIRTAAANRAVVIKAHDEDFRVVNGMDDCAKAKLCNGTSLCFSPKDCETVQDRTINGKLPLCRLTPSPLRKPNCFVAPSPREEYSASPAHSPPKTLFGFLAAPSAKPTLEAESPRQRTRSLPSSTGNSTVATTLPRKSSLKSCHSSACALNCMGGQRGVAAVGGCRCLRGHRSDLVVRFADSVGKDLVTVCILEETGCHEESGCNGSPESPFSSPYRSNLGTFKYGFTAPLRRLSIGASSELLRSQRVLLEDARCFAADLSLRGIVRVANLDFAKAVYVRISTDDWRSMREYVAAYLGPADNGAVDRFVFRIALAPATASAHPMRIAFAVRFHCAGQQFWDNNDGNDYTAEYVPPAEVASPPSAASKEEAESESP